MPEDTPARDDDDRVPDLPGPALQPDEPDGTDSTEAPQPPDGFQPL
ncbi:hypothetical protein OIE66_24295 [Nonomuraea sp. NBC_01738]|nr:hypothetical protein OIE66_24295 [Nonomuraea sp. NBC_01738]